VTPADFSAGVAPSTSLRAIPRKWLRKLLPVPTSWPFFMSPFDIGLFLRSARTDAAIVRMRNQHGGRAAFEAVYRDKQDPWGSASLRYSYQRRKYDKIVEVLPRRPFRHALDLGCGLGLLSQRLTTRADATLGLDVAETAVELARARARVQHAQLRAGGRNGPAAQPGWLF